MDQPFLIFFKKINFDHYDIVIDTQKRFLTTLLLKKKFLQIFLFLHQVIFCFQIYHWQQNQKKILV